MNLDDDKVVLWIAVAALMFGGGFLFIFYLGGQTDYNLPGTDVPTGDFLRDNLPQWMFVPER